jgi:hypothetical protein
VVRLPAGEFGLLDVYEVEFGADRAKHGSPHLNSLIVVNLIKPPFLRLL